MKWAEGSVYQRVLMKLEKFPVTMLGLHWFIVEQERNSEWCFTAKVPIAIDKPQSTITVESSILPPPPSEQSPNVPPE
jgi:hypothetical protein